MPWEDSTGALGVKACLGRRPTLSEFVSRALAVRPAPPSASRSPGRLRALVGGHLRSASFTALEPALPTESNRRRVLPLVGVGRRLVARRVVHDARREL